MDFRIAGDRDLEIRNAHETGHEVGAVSVSARRRLVSRRPIGWVASQGHDVPDAVLPIVTRDIVDLLARGGDAGQVGCRFEPRFAP